MKHVGLAQITASPLRGEAERSSDEGDRDINFEKNLTKCQLVGQALPDKIPYINNTLSRLRHPPPREGTKVVRFFVKYREHEDKAAYLFAPSDTIYCFSIPCASRIKSHNSLTAPRPPLILDLKLQIS